jgi:two-component system, NarL family, response regulator NreC
MMRTGLSVNVRIDARGTARPCFGRTVGRRVVAFASVRTALIVAIAATKYVDNGSGSAYVARTCRRQLWCASAQRISPMITIALADHHRLIREGLRALLDRERDFKVVGEVADGLQVVRLVERRRPRVLLLALTVPGLNSFELTVRVRQRSPDTEVILLAMYAGDQYVTEALRCGAAGYVVTSASGVELIRAVRKVAAGGRYLSAPFSEHPIDAWLQRVKTRTPGPYDTLTSREREVLSLITEGCSSAEIAGRLSISRRTAESHRSSVMRKLHLSNQMDLIRFAIARGIVVLPWDPLRYLDRGPRRLGRT